LRDSVRSSAPADLTWLGIDSADLRWAAAQAYIRAARDAAGARIDLALRRFIWLQRVMKAWRRRGKPGFGPADSDFADATNAYRSLFREDVPPLAYTAAEPYGPTSAEALLRLAEDQRQYEAARAARKRDGAA